MSRLFPSRIIIVHSICTLIGYLVISIAPWTFSEACSAAEQHQAARPNILFILTDDQRWDCWSAYGNDRIHTPNLDRIADRGVRFNNAFVTLAICSPSRAACLTGRYGSVNGVTAVGSEKLNLGEPTFAKALGLAGYATGVTGKWHLKTTPQDCGFSFASTCWANGTWYDRKFNVDGRQQVMPGFVDDVIANESIRFIRQSQAQQKPFVLWMCTQVPHMDHRHTWPASEEALSEYRADSMSLPVTWNDDLSKKPEYLKTSRNRTQAMKYGYDDPENIRNHIRDYYASVVQMDAAVGRVLNELEQQNLQDNTWIIFMGDNGWMLGEHGMTSKVLPYEESMRVPMAIAGPQTVQRKSDELVLNIDITATMYELAGVAVPESLHGRSLLPIANGETPKNWRTSFLYEAPTPQLGSQPLWAVRNARWKYIETITDDTPQKTFAELYDLTSDPIELCNVVNDPANRPVVAQLAADLREQRNEIANQNPRRVAGNVNNLTTTEPKQVSGIYPHLAMYNSQGECGVGGVVPWAGRLWAITYSPHFPNGSDDKLYEITPDLEQIIRPESIGGTPANRMIHKESRQLFIGPYAIAADGKVRAIPYSTMPGRPTGNARHLQQPAEKIYFGTMEEGIYEVDVNSLEVTELFADDQKQTGHAPKDYEAPAGERLARLPGYHGKGLYSGQGVLIYANNGEPSWEAKNRPDIPSGALAEWDGKSQDWTVVRRNQFTEVSGPGGIGGNANPETDPIWSVGWDTKSVLLAVRMPNSGWSFYRLPKGSHSYDGAHGWNTEWPRIREVGEDSLMMTMHGTFWHFPKTFTPNRSAGIAPRSNYLKVVGDFCRWNERLIFACDDVAVNEFMNKRKAKGEIWPSQSHSNLWFVNPDSVDRLGPVIGRGMVWEQEDVEANQPSDPFLFSGYDLRCLHLTHGGTSSVSVVIEVDKLGDGQWTKLRDIEANSYSLITFEPEETGVWVRLICKTEAKAMTAAFSYRNTDGRDTKPAALFSGMAAKDQSFTGGVVRSRGKNKRSLSFLARDESGEEIGYYELDGELNLKRVDDPALATWTRKNTAIPTDVLTVDEASVLFIDDKQNRWRLPKGDPVFDDYPLGSYRIDRELVTERDLFNAHGTFYELPSPNSGGFTKIRPITTHNRLVHDYCGYRGLMVMSGVSADADDKNNPHIVQSDDGKAALWLGAIDDLWQFGKPQGYGGPWKNSKVVADEPSDPYLMTAYDQKTLTLEASEPTTVTVEVDITGDGGWVAYETFQLKANTELIHTFPREFSAYWVRFKANRSCVASALLDYK